MKKVICKARLNFEELTTINAEVEAAINSRLLTYIDGDPNNNTLISNHSYTEKIFMKSIITRNLKILQKIAAKTICKFFQNWIRNMLLANKRDIFKIN